jgi:acetyl-CoA synthetase
MAYPYQIKSLEQYHEVYKHSIENPEQFWGDIAIPFSLEKTF